MQKAMDDWNNTWSKIPQTLKDSLPESFQIEFKTDFENSKTFWQNVCLRTDKPEKKVLLAVREPVARFASTCAYMESDVEETLVALENKSKMVLDQHLCFVHRNTHFLPQHIYMGDNCKAYKFPEQLQQMCEDAGLNWPLPKINEGIFKKPQLTLQQVERIKKVYAEDVKLYESL